MSIMLSQAPRVRLAESDSSDLHVRRRGQRHTHGLAYQADQLDPVQRPGWSVAVTGLAAPITDPAELERLEQALIPWVAMDLDTMLAISPRIVSGFRLTHG